QAADPRRGAARRLLELRDGADQVHDGSAAHRARGAMIGPTLSIVVPALDEEQAIGDTLRRCTAARAQIMAEAGLGAVEIIAVSDGSTDRTEAIAREVEGVSVLAFDANRGYGTAIQTG